MPASLELVKIALKAYGDGDFEIALALSDPNLRWDERASRPDADLVWGHDNVGRAMRRYLGGWRSYRFELEDIAEAAPGKVVGICRERGVDAEGVPVDRRFGGLWVVEDAKIVSWSTYLTAKEAIRAARELAGGEARRPRPRRPKPAAVPEAEEPASEPRPPSPEQAPARGPSVGPARSRATDAHPPAPSEAKAEPARPSEADAHPPAPSEASTEPATPSEADADTPAPSEADADMPAPFTAPQRLRAAAKARARLRRHRAAS